MNHQPCAQNMLQPQSGHTFSAKEKDDETGYSYFGARYYDSELSVWLSVDPMAFKYPYQSPYSYVGNRPINTIDLWGLDEIKDPNGNNGNAGDGYKQTYDKKYLYGDGLQTKVWNPNLEYTNSENGGNLACSSAKGGYENYTGDAIDFENYQTDGNQQVSKDGLSADFIASICFSGTVAISRSGFNIINNEVVRQQIFNNSIVSKGQPIVDIVPLKIPKALKIVGKYGGLGFTFYGVYDINNQWINNQISTSKMAVEQFSNGIGAIPVFGTGWSIGWNLGKIWGPSTWYGTNDNKYFK